MKFLNFIKKLFTSQDPCKDPRCKDCTHIDGLICQYPLDCSAMISPIPSLINIYTFYKDHSKDIEWLLQHNRWLTVYKLPNSYWTYEYYLKGKTWSTLGSNSIFSSMHLYPHFSTEEDAWNAGIKHLKETLES